MKEKTKRLGYAVGMILCSTAIGVIFMTANFVIPKNKTIARLVADLSRTEAKRDSLKAEVEVGLSVDAEFKAIHRCLWWMNENGYFGQIFSPSELEVGILLYRKMGRAFPDTLKEGK